MSPRYQPHQLPPVVPDTIREKILNALKIDEYSFTGYGRNYLVGRNFDPEAVVAALIDYIESGYKIYLLSSPAVQGIKYQCCLNYGGFTVHAKMFQGDESSDENWHVILSFHDHDTGHPPLPR